MINEIIIQGLYWILILALAILIVALTNSLGLTARRETNRPKIYYIVIWITFAIAVTNLVISIHSKQIALLISPLALGGCSITMYLSNVMFIKREDESTIEALLEKVRYHRETIKVLICLVLFFFITVVYNDLRTHRFGLTNVKTTTTSP